MSSVMLRPRLITLLSKHNRRVLSSGVASNAPKEPLIAAEALAADQPPPPAADPNSTASVRKSWSFLKYAIAGALTGATAATGYLSYAYSLQEIEEKTKDLRAAPSRYKVPDDTPAFDKFKSLLYSSAMTVPAKATELYLDARKMIEEQVKGYTEPYAEKLLPDLHPMERHVFTLVLDLQETLLYSYWTREKGWQTIKRPGVDAFLEHLAQYYEIVVYSDYSNMYVDPVMERLDTKHCVRYRLGKAATRYQNGQHYRDLSKLNRDPGKIIYLSAHARENSLQPENGAPIKPFKLELDDTALLDFIPFLEFVARNPPADIRQVLASYEGCDIPEEFIRRSREHRRKMQEQKQQGRLWRR
ncbi:Mitochondrial import inner membrane translocase subunit TIM50 [Morus notabilis]|uniref:Mitochondrial import inner membrane translocase subunit TIM50 n=1 Tax=Morus notabilis TaxID=981085 RepID=W9QMZ2_9ROSA|nr:mitochondrial import inner membrane translocase subunit TIM50 [Morus notabilis]EXB36079.1 Mitochondrial import inner membrane translocase subunit TIM50 [Morus notabilis]